MSEWQFPNAIAECARAMARRNGQTSDRVYPRTPGDSWPAVTRVRLGSICGTGVPVRTHTDEWQLGLCDTCGELVEGR